MSPSEPAESCIALRTHGDAAHQALIYLPGVHGDWTLLASFRTAISQHFRFVEITYPRTLRWSMEDYANEAIKALSGNGIKSGWILAESFSSQVAWAMLAEQNRSRFHIDGVVLAGGFVRYPFVFNLNAARWMARLTPWPLWKMAFAIYGFYAQFRHRRAPETAASIPEFLSRRTPLDIAAMRHRFDLIRGYDPRPIACATAVPVYLLAGFFDPVVPPWPVRRWLRKHCPGYRGHRIIFPADHNVLGTEPAKAADQIVAWVGREQMNMQAGARS